MELATDLYKSLNRLVSNEISVKSESKPSDPYAEIFIMWLKITGKNYKVDESQTTDVCKGITSLSFEEACLDVITKKEAYDREYTYSVVISSVVQEMLQTIEKLNEQPVASDKRLIYYLHDLLQTLEDNIGSNGLYGENPSIYDCVVYAAVNNLMKDSNTAAHFDYHTKLIMFLNTIEVILQIKSECLD